MLRHRSQAFLLCSGDRARCTHLRRCLRLGTDAAGGACVDEAWNLLCGTIKQLQCLCDDRIARQPEVLVDFFGWC